MKYTESHEWVTVDKILERWCHSVSQKELGDIVYIELPQVGKSVKKGEEAAVLESTKAAADVYSPLSGRIVEVNTTLKTSPETVNHSPQQEAGSSNWN